jgi:hypothetical protein
MGVALCENVATNLVATPRPSRRRTMSDRPILARLENIPEGPTDTSLVSPSATVGLWRVLNALRDGWFLERRLREVARMIAGDARTRGLRAEQMLVALKRDWPKLLEGRRAPPEGELHMLSERLVSFCIHEYYAPERCAIGSCRAG